MGSAATLRRRRLINPSFVRYAINPFHRGYKIDGRIWRSVGMREKTRRCLQSASGQTTPGAFVVPYSGTGMCHMKQVVPIEPTPLGEHSSLWLRRCYKYKQNFVGAIGAIIEGERSCAAVQ